MVCVVLLFWAEICSVAANCPDVSDGTWVHEVIMAVIKINRYFVIFLFFYLIANVNIAQIKKTCQLVFLCLLRYALL